MPFWKMIKEGYDHFEVTRQEPKVEFCEQKYVFDPAAPAGATKPLAFNASAKCPAYVIPDEIAEPVRAKQAQDDAKVAELVAKGTPVAQRRPDIDGGMNRVFAAKIPDASTGLSDPETPGLQTAAYSRAPGTIPPTVNPPKANVAVATAAPSSFSSSEDPMNATAAPTRVASASSDGGGFFSNLARKVGLGGASADASAAMPSTPATAPTKPKVQTAKNGEKPGEPQHTATSVQKAAEPRQIALTKPALKPSLDQPASADPAATAAAPAPSPNSFDNRFSAMR
jgi:hypothetical protein